MREEGLATVSAPAGARAARPAAPGALRAARSRSTSPPCSATRLLPGAPRARWCRCCAPTPSSASGTRLLHRRGGLLLAILLAGGGALRPLPRSTPPTSTTRCCEQAERGRVPAARDAGVHRATTCEAGGKRRLLRATTPRRTTAPCFDPSLRAQHRLRPAQPGDRRLVQRVQRRSSAATCSSTSTARCRTACTGCSTRAWAASASWPWAAKETCRFTPHEAALRGAGRAHLPQGGLIVPRPRRLA